MAHKYWSFDAAFAVLETKWGEGYTEWGYIGARPYQIRVYADGGNYKQGLYECSYAIFNIYTLFQKLWNFYDAVSWKSPLMEALFWAGQAEEVEELTAKTICEAWIKDDFEGRGITIACIDRMRQILWNEPFDITWAARPEQQEL